MSGIVGSKFNHRGSGLIGSLGTDGQHMLSAGAGKTNVFETVAAPAAYDDEPIKSDLTALALREATNESSAAFNLPNSFIETFTNDTKLGTQTDGDRISGYWTTVIPLSWGTLTNFVANNWDKGALSVSTVGDGTAVHATSPGQSSLIVTNASATTPLTFTASQPFQVTATNAATTNGSFLAFYKVSEEPSGSPAENSDWTVAGLGSTDDGFTMQMGSNYGQVSFGDGSSQTNLVGSELAFRFSGLQFTVTRDAAGVFRIYQGTRSGTLILTSSSHGGESFSSTAEYALGFGGAGTVLCSLSNLQYAQGIAEAINATGTLIQSANTVASAKTIVGGTMLYKDNVGTATLGTDLKIYFTCDNSNWTEAAGYNSITPIYSTGIKQVRLSETTCTSGTDIRYKAVFANQSEGSKATQLHGIGINY